jgi:hypothetical protein
MGFLLFASEKAVALLTLLPFVSVLVSAQPRIFPAKIFHALVALYKWTGVTFPNLKTRISIELPLWKITEVKNKIRFPVLFVSLPAATIFDFVHATKFKTIY